MRAAVSNFVAAAPEIVRTAALGRPMSQPKMAEVGPPPLRGSRPSRRIDEAYELAMHRLVAGHHVAADPGRVGAVEVGNEPARLAHQDRSRRHIPRREAALPEAVEPPGRHPGEVERGRAEATQP